MDLNKLFQFTSPYGNSDIDVNFHNNEDLILTEISKYDAVLGCSPWFTNTKIIDALSRLNCGVCIITDKNAMQKYMEKYINKFNKIKPLDFCTSDLPDTNFYFDQLLNHGKNTSSVRVLGKPNSNTSTNSYLHYKFLILCKINEETKMKIEAKALITGSFNFSNNATNSREVLLSINDYHVIQCFFYEWAKAFILSENINNFSKTKMNPEFLTANTVEDIIEKIEAENIWLDKEELISNGLSKLYD